MSKPSQRIDLMVEEIRQSHDLRDRLLPILESEDPEVAINALASLLVHIIVHESTPSEWRAMARKWTDTILEMVEVEASA